MFNNSSVVISNTFAKAKTSMSVIKPKEKINLSDYEGFGFVVNSVGELLYNMNTPVKKHNSKINLKTDIFK